MLRKVVLILEMIKFEHSLFALPFALVSALYAFKGDYDLTKVALIIVAMVTARSSAMAFNRIADAEIDAKNPRTSNWAIPSGKVKKMEAIIFMLIMAGLFIVVCTLINKTCAMLAPLALVVLLGYSYTKRFTWLTHFVLGICLAMAPVGAWLAIKEEMTLFPSILAIGVIFWVAGFDIIYHRLDADFDRIHGIKSIPAIFGHKTAMVLSAICHLVMFGLLITLDFVGGFGIFYRSGLALIAGLLLYEHWTARSQDPAGINLAFFNMNAMVSVILMLAIMLEVLVK